MFYHTNEEGAYQSPFCHFAGFVAGMVAGSFTTPRKTGFFSVRRTMIIAVINTITSQKIVDFLVSIDFPF